MQENMITIINDLPIFTGIGQYNLDLLNFLLENDYKIRYVCVDPPNIKSDRLQVNTVNDPFKNFKFGTNLKLITLTNVFQFHGFLRGPTHITSQFLIPLGRNREDVAITVHDLSQFHMTGVDFFSTGVTVLKLNLLDKYRHIVTVSNFVKLDLLKHFRIEDSTVSVIYNWLDLSKFKVSTKKFAKKDGDDILILHVGSDQPNKNIILLYKLLLALPDNFKLVRVGRNSERNIRFVKRNNLSKRVTFYNKISRERLEELYNMSDIFVYPSIAEGFGRPLLEAMAYGLPVIYRNSSSLPEIAGNAGLAFDDDDAKNLSELIYRTVESNRYNVLREKSLERSKYFDISNQKKNILKFYDGIFK